MEGLQARRGVFGEEQNALRARSIQRVQLWKGLQPSALREAVSHFAKVCIHNVAIETRAARLETPKAVS